MKAWPILGIATLQALLLLAHWFIYRTWIDFHPGLSNATIRLILIALMALACSFVTAALLSFRFSNALVRLLYRIAAVWMGTLNFFFWAACLCWLEAALLQAFRVNYDPASLANVLFALAVLVVAFGIVNARWIRIRSMEVALPNLPESWRGRTALLLSDLHLGHVNNLGFSRRIARLAEQLQPEMIFIPGDIFDGAKVDADHLLAPFKALAPPLGIYFSTGNHDEFGGADHYNAALARAGVNVLENQSTLVDGVRIVGVSYGLSTHPLALRQFLEGLKLGDGGPSILLNHVPNRLPTTAGAGVSLQLSGHTHGGQIFPFTWFTRRVFGKFTHGLHPFGKMQVYTSMGAGTWGPPMRIGSHSEVVLITFENQDGDKLGQH